MPLARQRSILEKGVSILEFFLTGIRKILPTLLTLASHAHHRTILIAEADKGLGGN